MVELMVMSVLGPWDPVTYGGAGPGPQYGYNSVSGEEAAVYHYR